MGILNVTPDSFSDGGTYRDPDSAIAAGLAMIGDGAEIVDVGGESTRPGAQGVSVPEELERVLPVVEGLTDAGTTVSIDTSKAEVARRCIAAGAHIVNDVTAFSDPDMAGVCAESGVGVVLMHMLGSPRTMQNNPTYDDVGSQIAGFLASRAGVAIESGVDAASIAVDPGFGFGKTVAHNLELMSRLDEIVALGYPVVVGTSRKRFLGSVLAGVRGDTTPSQRDDATLATVALAVDKGATIFRVHNVRSVADVALTADAIVTVEGYDQETDRTRT
ncbi:MAG: dihydropteroate synthase [Acidimicrobiia bacterium]|nr:MAG: dihydropteroate synthase [Acidimicrobiia bacterium]